MANTKSAIKRARTAKLRRQRNQAAKTQIKTAIRRLRDALQTGDANLANEAYRLCSSRLDKAASKGIIHKNAAARKKGRLARSLQTLQG
ncbi:MAG TPA: 30S ribosomal protein S20 [Firmicutes bacterium]|jgi:small subunit ribosomal protein S20|nr:30S ribosomal protein S20 [Bacillota bacterium]